VTRALRWFTTGQWRHAHREHSQRISEVASHLKLLDFAGRFDPREPQYLPQSLLKRMTPLYGRPAGYEEHGILGHQSENAFHITVPGCLMPCIDKVTDCSFIGVHVISVMPPDGAIQWPGSCGAAHTVSVLDQHSILAIDAPGQPRGKHDREHYQYWSTGAESKKDRKAESQQKHLNCPR
jgi:hypothetical protein